MYSILIGKSGRALKSRDYNFIFNSVNGFFARWGKTKNDDPEFSPFGPEILDIEISTICNMGCKHCYKSNTGDGKNMSFKTFKLLFEKFPKTVTQIAFGIGGIDTNPDLWKIMEYCRENCVIPNITINGHGITDKHIEKLSETCGAVAVSMYDFNECFNTVERLSNCKNKPRTTIKQVNIHCLLSEETFGRCANMLNYQHSDKRLKNMDAIVYLRLKPKGRGQNYHQASKEQFEELIKIATYNNCRIGMDSCSAPFYLDCIKREPNYKEIEQLVEPCESTLFSYYINTDGIGFPCSFCEGRPNYKGIDILKCKNFIKDVWFNKETSRFRKSCIESKDCNGCRNCIEYNLKNKH